MTGRPNIVLCDVVGRDSCEGNAPFGPEKASRQLITRMNRTRMNRASCYADSDRPHPTHSRAERNLTRAQDLVFL